MARQALGAKYDAKSVEEKRATASRHEATQMLRGSNGKRRKWSEMSKAERDDMARVVALHLGLIEPEEG